MQSPFLCTAKIPPTVKASGSTARAKAEPTHPGTDHIPPATSLRLHGLIERIPKSYRYRITANGLRTAIFYTRLYNRALRTGLAIISQRETDYKLPIAKSIRAAEVAVNNWYDDEKLAA